MTAKRVLYISYNGIQEPLVASQVLAYLERLSELDIQFHLLTFEKIPPSPTAEAEIRADLLRSGIRWSWLRYHARPRLLVTGLDVARGVSLSAQIVRDEEINLVHARSFVPGLIARCLHKRTGVPYLFDIRGFWVDEKVYKGSFRAEGVAYRLAKRLEAAVYRSAAGIVSLTHAGVEVLRESGYWRGAKVPPTVVIPTCTDLDRFAQAVEPAERRSDSRPRPLTFVYVGSLGPGYLPSELARYFAAAREHFPDAKLRVVTRSDHEAFRTTLAQCGLAEAPVELVRAEHSEIPQFLASAHVALCFIEPHFSKLASCPTKLGEYLASGLPVVANSIGDVERVLTSKRRTGVVLKDFSDASFTASLNALDTLFGVELSRECVQTAEDWFDLGDAVRSYHSMYSTLLDGNTRDLKETRQDR